MCPQHHGTARLPAAGETASISGGLLWVKAVIMQSVELYGSTMFEAGQTWKKVACSRASQGLQSSRTVVHTVMNIHIRFDVQVTVHRDKFL